VNAAARLVLPVEQNALPVAGRPVYPARRERDPFPITPRSPEK
jgi:hypothetical protein